jgi:argininosuccinate synthase
VTFTADLGQGEELEPARKKAEMLGIKPENIFIDDVREEFVRDFVFPMFRANAVYEGLYLLGTSIARPLISKHQIEIAAEDRRRRRGPWRHRQGQRSGPLRARPIALDPDIKVIAPWREWDLQVSRTALIDFAEKHQIPIAKDKRGEAPFSVDANLLHSSSEGKVLEDPWVEPRLRLSAHHLPRTRPTRRPIIEIGFEKGDAVAINGEAMSPATC